MTISDSTSSTKGEKANRLLDRIRHALTGRRVLWFAAALAAALGLTLKWNWLVAAGVAPVLVSLLPCAAMCALGFCAHKAISPAPAKPQKIDGDVKSELSEKG